MDEPVDVVAVMVGEDDFRDVAEVEAGRAKSAGQLLRGSDVEAGERDVAGGGDLAGVDQQQTALVLHRPAVDRQRPSPFSRQGQVELARPARPRGKGGTSGPRP